MRRQVSQRERPFDIVPLTLTLSPQGRGDKNRILLSPTRQGRADTTNRQGLTLLEVILALAIFVSAMAVLSELVATGHRANLQARLQTIAVIRAESQMNEVIANPSLMVAASSMPFAEEYNPGSVGQWVWSLAVQSWDQNTNLLQLELTVQHLDSGGNPNASYTLRRYVRDPQAILESQTAADAAASTEGSLF